MKKCGGAVRHRFVITFLVFVYVWRGYSNHIFKMIRCCLMRGVTLDDKKPSALEEEIEMVILRHTPSET